MDRNIDPAGITGRRLAVVMAACLGSPTVAFTATANADVFTSQAHASFTAGAGTQPTAPRNLRYEGSFSSTVAFASAAGTISVSGYNHQGIGILETIAVSALASASANGIQGSKIFASIVSNGITRGGITLSNTTHAQSNNVSWYIGGGPWLGVPSYVKDASGIKHARVGTSPVATAISLMTTRFDKNGSFAAVNLSAGVYASNKPVAVWYALNG
jgi:hypothetical protein